VHWRKWNNMEALPKIRAELDAVECNDGSGMFLLYDRSGLSRAQLVVSPQVMFVISCLDGGCSELELQEKTEEQTGIRLQVIELDEIISKMDQSLFLDNENFREYYNSLQAEFFNNPLRKMVCAGSAYLEDEVALKNDLQKMIDMAPAAVEEGRATNATRPAPKAVIVPHMDYARAGAAYGQLYSELKKYTPPEAVLIIGTAHQPLKNRFALCDKNFEIPGGVVAAHQEFCAELVERCSGEMDLREEMFAHRFEHSIELQAVWLNHIWGSGVKIIPLLVGMLDDYFAEPENAAHDRTICTLVNSIRDMLPGRKIMMMASADLSHIGPRFGDEREVSEDFLRDTQVADMEYLAAVKNGQATEALCSLASHDDKFHVCGTGCIYIMNSILPQVKGRLLGYYQCVTGQLQQAVTCASVIYEQ